MIDRPIGLESLGIGNTQVSISANARLLNENYKQGFCLNTVDQLRDILKKNGLLLHEDFIKESVLNLAHVKNDIDIDIDDIISELELITPSKFFKVIRDNGITFESINKGDKMAVNVYGKYYEMTIANKSKYKGLDINFEDFKGLSRMESRLNDWRTVKKYLGSRNMHDILQQKNTNYIMLMNILKGQSIETPKLDLGQFKTISQLDDYARTKLLFEQCNGNYGLMVTELKKRLGNNTKATYQTNKIKKLLPLVQSPGGRKLECLQNLKEQLKE